MMESSWHSNNSEIIRQSGQIDQDWKSTDAGQDSHGKNQEELGKPRGSHRAKDMRSLMQSVLELLKHSR